MAGYNRIVLVGNLTRDPEYKQLASGQGVCKLSLATNRQFKNRQTGVMMQEVCYIDIDVWGAQAESCRQYLQKGREVLIEGRLKYDMWEEANGQKRSKHSVVADRVVFLSSAGVTADVETTEKSDAFNSARAQELPEPKNEMERDLFSQIDAIKTRTNKKAKKKEIETDIVPDTGEIDFKDTPPFEDELPF